MHGPVGGSTWLQDAAWLIWDGKDLDRTAGAVSVHNISSVMLSMTLLRIGRISVKTVTVLYNLSRLS